MAYNAAVRGLSAQGANSLRGMCYSNNDVVFTMTSSEFANSGFKYIVRIEDGITGEDYKFYIAPNAVGSGVFNCKTIFNQLVPTSLVIPGSDDILIQISEPLLSNQMMSNVFNVRLYEGYDVAGVFTEDNSVEIAYGLMCVYGKGKSNFLVMGSNDTPAIALSQCFDNTIGFNAETIASRINIPLTLQQEIINWQRISRSNVTGAKDSAYKILSFIADDGSILNSNYPFYSMAYATFNFYDNEYNLISTFNMTFIKDVGSLYHLPVGLKNLVDGGYIDQDDADITSFWTVVINDPNGDALSAKYGFYIDEDCKHNPVHVYWLNQKGGWDSYSFIKKNERSIEVEKKRYKQYLGDYNGASVENPFDTKNYSRSLTEREPILKTFINLTSDWVTESEFKFMKDLFQSKSVWMVDDNVDGYNILPVVVEDNNFLMRRERNSRKYNQSLRLQLANEYDTLNITASEYPIPGPAPCDYYSVFTQTTGTTRLYLAGVVDGAAHIIANNATRDRYVQIAVNDSSGNTPIAGQTYWIKIDYDFTPPNQVVRVGQITLGNVATGGGAIIPLQGFQTPGTPIIVTGIWGTHPTTNANYFRLNIPGWRDTPNPNTVSGNIYVTIGFGNCP
jgi:hypothetical protein